MKIKKNFGRIIISLIVSIVIFIGLLVIQQTILAPNGTSKVYISNNTIDKGTLINLDNVDKLFKEKKVDGELKVSNAVIDKKDLINKIANTEIEKGSVISNSSFIDKDNVLSKIKNMVETSIKVNDISEVVGGTLRTGDIVNISTVNQITKESESVLENVYVNKVFASDGREINRSDKTSAMTINILISKEDEQKLNKKIILGTIRISKVE
jgi:hypothetical protein